MPAIKQWLENARGELTRAKISSPRLDAEIILAHTLRKPRTFLHAHSDILLSSRQTEIADARLRLRLDRTPIAYIIGHKEFYGRVFNVTPATLIPRPESEAIITLLKTLQPKNNSILPKTARLVDIGTGTGCLGVTAKLEVPELDVTLLDISHQALNVARSNAKLLKADVTLHKSDLLASYPFSSHYILANLPYVDQAWERSLETNHEPKLALFADDNGLHLIKKLLSQTKTKLTTGGFLLLEADPRQHTEIIGVAKTHGLQLHLTEGFILCFLKN